VLLTSSHSDSPLSNLDYQDKVMEIAGQVSEKKATRLVSDLEHSFVRLNTANLQLMLDNLLIHWPYY